MKIFGSEITPYAFYLNRRKFIKNTMAASIASTFSSQVWAKHVDEKNSYNKQLNKDDKLNKYEEITSYNNFNLLNCFRRMKSHIGFS